MSRSTFCFTALSIVALTGAIGILISRADDRKEGPEIPPVKRADDQAEAIEEARKVDLPLLEKADKVVVERIAESKAAGKGHRVILEKADDLKELREALKPRMTPPSGGRTAVTLTFYQGQSRLRKIWVFERGEWGFERPGTSWTTGREADLWRIIQKHLK